MLGLVGHCEVRYLLAGWGATDGSITRGVIVDPSRVATIDMVSHDDLLQDMLKWSLRETADRLTEGSEKLRMAAPLWF